MSFVYNRLIHILYKGILMKYLFALLLISGSVFADYKSEEPAIRKFEQEEFLNAKNYGPTTPGKIPTMLKSFHEKLAAEPKSLKYFTLLAIETRLANRYKLDKPFALALESKFGGKKMTPASWKKVSAYVGDIVLKESDSTIKKANQKDSAHFQAYYEEILAKVKSATF